MTLSKLTLGTFSDVQRKLSLHKEGETVISRVNRNVFALLQTTGQSRKVDFQELLAQELGPGPGSFAKTNKADLSNLLENGVDILQHLPAQATAVAIPFYGNTLSVPINLNRT